MLDLLYHLLLAMFSGLAVCPLFFWGACPCCGVCSLVNDTFATDTSANYTAVSGSWSVGSGVLTTSSANALLIHNTTTSLARGYVTCTAVSSTTGAQARLIGAYADSNNYWFGEATFGAATTDFKLYRRVAGVNTQIGSTKTSSSGTGVTATMRLCWTTNGVTMTLTHSAYTASLGDSYSSPTGQQAGMGTATTGGTVTFDNFTLDNDNATLPACHDCGDCSCGVPHQLLQVDISGITAPAGCANCANWDGTYLHQRNFGSLNCLWQTGTYTAAGCIVSGAGFGLLWNGALDMRQGFVRLWYLQEGGGGAYVGAEYTGNQVDCLLDGDYSETLTYSTVHADWPCTGHATATVDIQQI